MALQDTPPLADVTTGRIPQYTQVLKQDPATGVYSIKYDVKATPTTDSALTQLTTPVTELPGQTYNVGTSSALQKANSGGTQSSSYTYTSTATGEPIPEPQGGGEGRDNQNFTGTPMSERSVKDLGSVLNPSKLKTATITAITTLGPSALGGLIAFGTSLEQQAAVKELNRRADTGTLGVNADGSLVTNKEFSDMAKSIYGSVNEDDGTGIKYGIPGFRRTLSPEVNSAIKAAKFFGDINDLTGEPSTSVAFQLQNPQSFEEMMKEMEEYDATQTSKTKEFGDLSGVSTTGPVQYRGQMPQGFVDPSGVAPFDSAAEKFSSFKSSAINEGDYAAAMDNSMKESGYRGLSRDTAEENKAKDFSAATANAGFGYDGETKTQFKGTSMESTQTGTFSERRAKEKEGLNPDGSTQSGSVAEARDIAGKQEREPGTSVNTDDAVDNKARKNEVGDKYGNAVTNTQTNSDGTTTTTAVTSNPANNPKLKEKQKDKNTSTRIICTELYRQGLLSKKDYMLDLYYTSKHLTPQHTAGYWYFAVPAVKAMRRSKFWTLFFKHIATNRIQDIKWRLNKGKFNLKGRIYSLIFEPFFYISGYFKPNATYKELYKGEV